MRILLHRADGMTDPWVTDFAEPPAASRSGGVAGRRRKPVRATMRSCGPARRALLGQLPDVKAIFLAGAGVDGLQVRRRAAGGAPIIRLGDAGMAVQMAEYVTHAVLRYFRRFDEYEKQARRGLWAPLPQLDRKISRSA